MSDPNNERIRQRYADYLRRRVENGNLNIESLIALAAYYRSPDDQYAILAELGEEGSLKGLVPPSGSVWMDETFCADERGNIWLWDPDDGKHLIYVRLELLKRLWLEIEIIPPNYPALSVKVVAVEDADLAKHINQLSTAFLIRKCNIAGVRYQNKLQGKWPILIDDDAARMLDEEGETYQYTQPA